MSNLKEWLRKRRSLFYEGETLEHYCNEFMKMVGNGATVHEFKEAIIVLEDYGLVGNVRGWLLFDKFSRATARAMKKVTDEFKGVALYTSTHDPRIKNILIKFGYELYASDPSDFYLVKRGVTHGL